MDVKKTAKGPQVFLSRSHPCLVKMLFELEVPEIQDGTVEILGIAREAGSRTKMAVFSEDENVDPVGACVGPRGTRVQNVVDELNGEKIDIISWSDDPVELITNVLSPAEVEEVIIEDYDEKIATVIVPDYQLSLAIGKQGQNVRLAAKVSGWKIDIKSNSQYEEEDADEDFYDELNEPDELNGPDEADGPDEFAESEELSEPSESDEVNELDEPDRLSEQNELDGPNGSDEVYEPVLEEEDILEPTQE